MSKEFDSKQPEMMTLRTGEEFAKVVSSPVALIDFWADYCAPCRKQHQILTELAANLKGKVVIATANIGESDMAQKAEELGVDATPTLFIYKNGVQTGRFVGVQSEETLMNALQ